MHQAHGPIEAHVQNMPCHLSILQDLFICSFTIEARLQELQVHIAKLIEEKTVGGCGGIGKLILLQTFIGLLSTEGKSGEDPPILPSQGKVRTQCAWESEIVAKVHQAKSGGIPHFVAEMAISHHTIDVQVHIPSLESIS